MKGLNAQDVTITDQTGTLLWPNAGLQRGGQCDDEAPGRQLYSAQLSAEINAMLTSTLGPTRRSPGFRPTLNVDQTTVEKMTYAKKGMPLSKQTQSETLQSKGGGAVAAGGRRTTRPRRAAAGAGSKSNYRTRVGHDLPSGSTRRFSAGWSLRAR